MFTFFAVVLNGDGRSALSLADRVQQSRCDSTDQYWNDLVRLTDERVQRVSILLLFPQ
jgi:hypothetical protein